MQMSSTPVVKDLVLVGGGHAHVAVLRRFGMHPLPGLRLTLVTRDVHTPYSGMLPGYVAGHYDYDACHIDLRPLAQFAGARLYHAEVEGLDLGSRTLRVAGRPAGGLRPACPSTPARGRAPWTSRVPRSTPSPVKPIDRFPDRLGGAHRPRSWRAAAPSASVVVGGGAGGVEVALATQYRLRRLLAEARRRPGRGCASPC